MPSSPGSPKNTAHSPRFATPETIDRPGVIAYAEAEFTLWAASHLHMTAGMGITPAIRAR